MDTVYLTVVVFFDTASVSMDNNAFWAALYILDQLPIAKDMVGCFAVEQ